MLWARSSGNGPQVRVLKRLEAMRLPSLGNRFFPGTHQEKDRPLISAHERFVHAPLEHDRGRNGLERKTRGRMPGTRRPGHPAASLSSFTDESLLLTTDLATKIRGNPRVKWEGYVADFDDPRRSRASMRFFSCMGARVRDLRVLGTMEELDSKVRPGSPVARSRSDPSRSLGNHQHPRLARQHPGKTEELP